MPRGSSRRGETAVDRNSRCCARGCPCRLRDHEAVDRRALCGGSQERSCDLGAMAGKQDRREFRRLDQAGRQLFNGRRGGRYNTGRRLCYGFRFDRLELCIARCSFSWRKPRHAWRPGGSRFGAQESPVHVDEHRDRSSVLPVERLLRVWSGDRSIRDDLRLSDVQPARCTSTNILDERQREQRMVATGRMATLALRGFHNLVPLRRVLKAGRR
jgi:hypothetical protein